MNHYYNTDRLNEFPFVTYAIWVTIAIAVAYQFIGAITYLLIPEGSRDESLMMITGLSQLLLILVPSILFARVIPLEWKEIFRLKRFPRFNEYAIAILGLLFVNLIASGVSDLQKLLIPTEMMDFYNNIMETFDEMYNSIFANVSFIGLLTAIFAGAFIPGVSEEFLMRGFLQRTLEVKMKPMIAILITAFLFAAIHLNPVDFLPLMIFGIYLGLIAYITKSILIPIVIHILNNAIAITVMTNIDFDESPLGRGDLPDLMSLGFVIIGIAVLYGVIVALSKISSANQINQE